MNWPNDGAPVLDGERIDRLRALLRAEPEVSWWARIWRRVLSTDDEAGTPRRVRGHEDMVKER